MSRPRKPKPYYRREFLNLPGNHSIALALADVKLDGVSAISGTLMIGDCNRQVSIDLDIWDVTDLAFIKSQLHKINLLVEIVTDVRDVFADAVAYAQANS